MLGCTYDPQQVGLFVWARIPDDATDCYAVTDDVLDKAHVFITPGGIFGSSGNRYIRISLCAKTEVLDQAIERIKTIR